MPVTNKDFHSAKRNRKDEFYTILSVVEDELRHYKDYFKGKVVFCNCDDPYESNFFKYFAMSFNFLGLKKLIATCYVSSPVMYTQLSLFDDMEYSFEPKVNKKPYKVEISEVSDVNGDGSFDLEDIRSLLKNKKNVCTVLQGDGDFRSEECIELLKEADIVVTNPPFSLFREYVAQLVAYEKKFIILGNQNAITYKEIFPLIRDNKMWYGVSIHSHGRDFRVPDDYPLEGYECRTDDDGYKYINVKGVRWFTNIDYEQRHEYLILYKKYSPAEYPQYDNYDAIEVGKTAEIPSDYYGEIGVPISFLDKYNPEQFEIIGSFNNSNIEKKSEEGYVLSKNTPTIIGGVEKMWNGPVVNKMPLYKRIVIRRKEQPT